MHFFPHTHTKPCSWISIKIAWIPHLMINFEIYIMREKVPVFIAEIAPKDLRGGFTSSNEVGELQIMSDKIVNDAYFLLTFFGFSTAHDSSWGIHHLPARDGSNMENARFSWYIYHFSFVCIIPNLLCNTTYSDWVRKWQGLIDGWSLYEGLIPSLMLILGMFFVPESPRWLVSYRNRNKSLH